LREGVERELALLVYDTSQTAAANAFLYSPQLTQLLIIQAKFRLMRSEYPLLIGDVKQKGTSLDELLQEAGQLGLTLEELEELSIGISSRQRSFIEWISKLEERIETVKVNARNLKSLLADPLWGDAGPELERTLCPAIDLLQDQMTMDLRYQQITQTQASHAMQSLLTVTGVRGTQQERYVTLMLGILGIGVGVMGMAQCLPDNMLAWRFAVVLLSTIGMFIGVIWLWKKRR
jgi:hypothetical protein